MPDHLFLARLPLILRLLVSMHRLRVSPSHWGSGLGVMTKRSRVVSIACRIGLLALAGAFAHSSARAQSADLVLCDRLAAEPSDPDKPKDVKGVAEIATADIATAIKFCRTASASSRRALYHLGRAYAANQHIPDAI